MKKILSLFIVAIIALSSVTKMDAQEFDTKSMVASAGIGLGFTNTLSLLSDVSYWPAFIVSFEKGFKEINKVGVISIGGIIGIQHSSVGNIKSNDIYLGGRGAFHFTIIDVDKLDLYAGLSLGLRFYSEPVPKIVYNQYGYISNYTWEKKTYTGLFTGVFAGARYYLADNIAVFSELGYDISYFKLGASFKF